MSNYTDDSKNPPISSCSGPPELCRGGNAVEFGQSIGPDPQKLNAAYDTQTFPNWSEEKGVLGPVVKPAIPFWTQDPNILLNSAYIFELFPAESMTYEQKLNAVSRAVILLTIIGFALSKSTRLLVISAITLFAIFIMYYYHQKDKTKREAFSNPAFAALDANGIEIPSDVFAEPTEQNPFENVLMTDYDFNPQKKPAGPVDKLSDKILEGAKRQVVDLHPDQPDIADKLFKSLGDQYVFEQSLLPFNSMASTTIPNDQKAFADFCYGSMISCKEGNMFACARNLSTHANN